MGLFDFLAGRSPNALVRAAAAGNLARVRAILEGGVPVDAPGGGFTALMCAASNGRVDVVRLLLDRGASPLASFGGDGTTCLHGVAQSDTHPEIADAILARVSDVDVTSQVGVTPLMMAAQFGRLAMAERFLARGAGVNRIVSGSQPIDPLPGDVQGFTPLAFAIFGDHEAMVARLIAAGARPGARLASGFSELTMAAAGGSDARIIDHLAHAGADPNEVIREGPLSGMTALMLACVALPKGLAQATLVEQASWLANRSNIVFALLRAGADRRHRDPRGRTALDLARQAGDPMLENALRE